MCSRKINDTRDDREEDAREIRALLKRRAAARVHWGYWLAAIGTTAIALLAWGLLLAYGLPDDISHISLRDGTLMTFSVLLGGAAIGSIAVFVAVRNQQRLAAEQDRINAYRDERMTNLVRDLVQVILNEGDQDTQAAMHAVQNLIDGPAKVTHINDARGR